MTDFSKILDKAKELEAKMKESQQKIKEIRVEGVSGSNSVKITLDGEGEMQTIKLSDEIMKEDKTIIEDLIVDLNLYLQEIENHESNLPEIQKRLFFLKNLERTFSLDLTQLIQKRDQLKTYFQQNDQGSDISRIQAQIENLQSNLNSLFVIQSTERKKIAKQLQNSVMSILSNLGLENANFSIQFSEC